MLPVLIAAGALTSAYGAFQGAAQTEALGELQGALFRQQAKSVEEAGAEQERRYRLDIDRLVGAQRSAYAGQGVALDSGTALEVQGETARIGELDALQIRHNAALQAWGLRAQGAIAEFGADASADAQRFGGLGQLAGTGSLLFGG